ncbi:hypothetical protein VP150E351_P0152 [Vibrio phage 150E35-1]|nr:hypothetical protein VP150E351_P0152 [Vibrio phage 150E35-1]
MKGRSNKMKTRQYMSLYGSGMEKLEATGISKRRAKKLIKSFHTNFGNGILESVV